LTTYSFLDVHAAIIGPGGGFPLGSDQGAAEEGITIARDEDKNTMTKGADGSVMHSLHAAKAGQVTVRLLKTSPVNALLMGLYNYQTGSSTLHGQNTVTLVDTARGDTMTARDVAFKKVPDLTWAKVGNTNEWVFDAGKIDGLLGVGRPSI